MPGGKPPEYEITIQRRKGNTYPQVIGVGWNNDYNGIDLVFHRGVNLSFRDCDDHFISVRPSKKHAEYLKKEERVKLELEEDDLPF